MPVRCYYEFLKENQENHELTRSIQKKQEQQLIFLYRQFPSWRVIPDILYLGLFFFFYFLLSWRFFLLKIFNRWLLSPLQRHFTSSAVKPPKGIKTHPSKRKQQSLKCKTCLKPIFNYPLPGAGAHCSIAYVISSTQVFRCCIHCLLCIL